ncbi:WbuC family cupin fold metalloprotein [endosymbiont of Ridgeia piscesae]|jgi:cupin fold WbuC family metalloprotein|uniref:Cupin fold metalloprotein, WbuC family n=1 Tax=endosymbiont of Ridgeia piscesae TaxID=54398 RepID=A0A0T5Z5B6_9GAMM|nr:WbuC family cupin fold metalloprotein [endosymbiont of Ridgeia piscesae]KRT53878.1 cupin fold metalloprotein, WbuC family [endosymbiont of Ridgeia piscesae]KRT58089.1 cupin fold metalloprotein, WbuC family [endosymbiont of Ridgeia piscesae]
MLKLLDDSVIAGLIESSRNASRRRSHHCFHADHSEMVQRMAMAAQPGTYYRPHRHLAPSTWEFLIILQGCCGHLTFDESGAVLSRTELNAAGPVRGLEVAAGVWHALVALAPDTLLFEFKQGPFKPIAEADFASWAPAEGEAAAAQFEAWFRQAGVGERPPRRAD